MANDSAHISLALHNIDTASHLLQSTGFDDWAVTSLFYAALHVVEAAFYYDKKIDVRHSDDHYMRHGKLVSTPHYRHIFKNYKPLKDASTVARYGPDTAGHRSFGGYLSRADIQNKIISRHFWQLIKSASNLIDPDHAVQIQDHFHQKLKN